METLAAAQPSTPNIGRRSRDNIFLLLMLGTLWVILWWHLSGEWSINEQYNYGWFVPFFALYLFWLRWQDRPQQSQISNLESRILTVIAVFTLLLVLPIRLFEIGNPDWRLLSWIHAAFVVTLTFVYIWSIGGTPWLRHFAFPVAFILVAVPWVTPVEVPIVQGLMGAVARVAAETVTLFGVPAQFEGNLIRVTNGLVGVNEACSGIRSLQTSLMIGLLFGELKRLPLSRRIALVVGATAIALVANFCRAVFLVWVAAAKNISEVTHWHDVAGYTIVAFVFVGTLFLAYLLGGKKSSDAVVAVVSPANTGKLQPAPPQQRCPMVSSSGAFYVVAFCWLVIVEVSIATWYGAHEGNLVRSRRWHVRWPDTAPNFRTLKIDNEIRQVLRFDEEQAAVWTLPCAKSQTKLKGSEPSSIACFLYFFRWNPGRNSALLANLHRPDVCLPAIGWTQVADTGVRNYAVTSSFALPFRHFEFSHGGQDVPSQQIAHVFFCLWEDRAINPAAADSKLSLMSGNPSSWTRTERIRTVTEGRRNLGQQAMEFITLNRGTVDSDEIEARFAKALPELIKIEPVK